MKAFFTKVVGVVVAGVMGIMSTTAAVAEPIDRIKAKATFNRAKSFDVVYEKDDPNQLKPTKDDQGNWVFTTDEEFKVVQLTDVHIGGGLLSMSRDMKALNAVAAMLKVEKPDLVVITGDMAYPVPYQSGTANNAVSADILLTLLDHLGVYYTVTFGNHDTENYSAYDREEIATKFYANGSHPKCLFQANLEIPEAKPWISDLDVKPDYVDGVGNHVIKVQNTKGKITNAFFMIDSNAYTSDDPTGLSWDYDDIHQDQVDWYVNELEKINNYNSQLNGFKPDTSCSSSTFFHIPIKEYNDAWTEYKAANYKETDNVKVIDGGFHEKEEKSWFGQGNDQLFEEMYKFANPNKAVFCGHDHVNNAIIHYKGIQLVYGMSIDYLAYPDLNFKGAQRGCNVITYGSDGTITPDLNSYYEKDASGKDRYPSKYRKEQVKMQFDNGKVNPNTAGVR